MPIAERLDELGKPAWIALAVLGFMVWWPLGVATLVYTVGSGRMGCGGRHGLGRWEGKADRMQAKVDRMRERMAGRGGWGAGGGFGGWGHGSGSGNKAFDDYRSETLRRLEDEQREFQDFLERLRFAKDKAEFDQFMNERRRGGASDQPEPRPAN